MNGIEFLSALSFNSLKQKLWFIALAASIFTYTGFADDHLDKTHLVYEATLVEEHAKSSFNFSTFFHSDLFRQVSSINGFGSDFRLLRFSLFHFNQTENHLYKSITQKAKSLKSQRNKPLVIAKVQSAKEYNSPLLLS